MAAILYFFQNEPKYIYKGVHYGLTVHCKPLDQVYARKKDTFLEKNTNAGDTTNPSTVTKLLTDYPQYH